MTSEYEIKTPNKASRKALRERLELLGTVTEYWEDGSFNFECNDEECEEKMQAICDELGIETELI